MPPPLPAVAAAMPLIVACRQPSTLHYASLFPITRRNSGMKIGHGHGHLIPDAVPIMMPPAQLAVTLENCVEDIDVNAKDNIDGLSTRRAVENRRCRRGSVAAMVKKEYEIFLCVRYGWMCLANIQTYPNISNHILPISKHIETYPNISKHIQPYLCERGF